MAERSRHEPVYYIGVAARLVGLHPQTLRTYEKLGLISPKRTKRGQRLYSEADLDRVRQIRHLTEELGVNLAGVEVILNLLEKIERLQAEVQRLREQLEMGPRPLKPAPSETRKVRVISIQEAERRGEQTAAS